MKIADLGYRMGYFTALIPRAVNQSQRLTLAFLDGVANNNTTETKKVIEFLKDATNLYQKTTFHLMTKRVQDLDTTNYFSLCANDSFRVLACMNIIHFLNLSEKQAFLKHVIDC